MKTILVPIDFSDISKNALFYAADLAAELSAKIVIFHTHDLSIENSIPVAVPAEDIESDSIAALNTFADLVKERHGDKVEVTFRFAFGLPVEEIVRVATSVKADLIVAGMPDRGFISERILGSTTVNVMLEAPCPVIAVHRDRKFTGIENVVLAADYQPLSAEIMKPLEDVLRTFSAHLYILNITRKNAAVKVGAQISAGLNLDYELRDVSHSFHDEEDRDVIEGIDRFAKHHRADLVVIVPRTHDWFTNLTREKTTKKAAFNLSIPVMAVHR